MHSITCCRIPSLALALTVLTSGCCKSSPAVAQPSPRVVTVTMRCLHDPPLAAMSPETLSSAPSDAARLDALAHRIEILEARMAQDWANCGDR